jgi:hypothetical protein
MRILGASANDAGGLLLEAGAAAHLDLPFLVVSDGEDVTAFIGEPGDEVGAVQRHAAQFLSGDAW